MPQNYKYTDFISVNDLPRKEQSVFEDNIGRKMVGMHFWRWKQLRGNSGSKGLSAERIYVLPENQIERDPNVRIESHAS